MTVLEVIQRSSEFLARKEVESPRLQSELLLAHLLQVPRLELYLNYDRVLAETELGQLRDYVKRRSLREPLQHILGAVSFCGLELAVDSRALIPRPETEFLADTAWNRVAEMKTDAPQILDFGTGSGCLAIALAVKCPQARLVALDISEAALDLARANARRHQVEDRIQFQAGNGLAALPEKSAFDLIVGNPPYIPTAEIKTLQPEVRNFDPHLALDGGADGLDFYRQLASEGPAFLNPDGQLLVEFGDGQSEMLQKIFQQQNWIVERVLPDYTRRPRVLTAHYPG